jgi:ComF family protein
LFPLIHYDERAKLILGEAKFKYAKEILKEVAIMLKPIYSNLPFKIDYLVPVPLSKERKNFRGFNQSEVLARGIGWKYKNILLRIRDTKSQATSKRGERIVNLENVFLVDSGYRVSGKNIVLIDDVYTTGSTLQECAKVLKVAGASKVIAIVWAKD